MSTPEEALRGLAKDAFVLMLSSGIPKPDAAGRVARLHSQFVRRVRQGGADCGVVARELLDEVRREVASGAVESAGAAGAAGAAPAPAATPSPASTSESAAPAATPPAEAPTAAPATAAAAASSPAPSATADDDMEVDTSKAASPAAAADPGAKPAATAKGDADMDAGDGAAGSGKPADGSGAGGAGGPPSLFSRFNGPLGAEPLTLAQLKALMTAAQGSSVFSEVNRVIGRVCSDPALVAISFLESDRAITRETDSGVKWDDVSELYRVVSQTEGPGNALTYALKTLVSEIDLGVRGYNNAAQLRPLLFAFLNPRLEDPDLHKEVSTLCNAIGKLTPEMRDIAKHWLARFNAAQLDHIVGVLQQFTTVTLLEGRVISDPVKAAVRVLQLVSDANDESERLTGKHTVDFTVFYNDVVNEEVNLVDDYDHWLSIRRERSSRGHDFSFCSYPALLDAHSKSRILTISAQDQMRREFRETLMRAMFTGTGEQPYLILAVNRESIVPDSLAQLAAHDPSSLRKPLKVRFEGEEGIDEGGVRKEWFQVLIRKLLDPQYAMFSENETTRLMWFRSDSLEAGIEFELVGTLLGLAIYNDVILDVHFPRCVYRKLLGLPMELQDVEEVFPEVAQSIRAVLEYEGNVEEDMGLAFDVVEEYFGSTRAVELKPGGSDIPVTNENREEWAKLYVEYLMVKSISTQYAAFARGFHKLCSGPVLELFRPAELELLVCGSPVLDFRELEEVTIYEDGFDSDSPTVRHFWTVVHSLTPLEQRQLLTFATGSDRAPIRGLGSLRFVISRAGPDSDNLPTSHTCFNHLLLPEYPTAEKMRSKLKVAISQSEGFGLI